MKRKKFIQNSILVGGFSMIKPFYLNASVFGTSNFPNVRVSISNRNFISESVEKAIDEIQKNVKDEELKWLFNNCFPNTLDTTVDYTLKNGSPDTYVITGDIDAMWLRDSSAQVWPYLDFISEDKKLRNLIAGVINRQTQNVLKDPYANAFYKDPDKIGKWKTDLTEMVPGVHERKYEIDSLCYTVRLAYSYWKKTNDISPFGIDWQKAVQLILMVFREQQQKENRGSYSFRRRTPKATDTRPMDGYGYPVKPVGLICSAFRPSDDATVYSFLIPSNYFAVVSLEQASEMILKISKDPSTAKDLKDLSVEVKDALEKYAIVNHKDYGDILAYEIDGFGNKLMMDDANIPSLLSLPYLDAISVNDPLYQNTRKFILSDSNPFFFQGKEGEGVGGPHVGIDMIWPMSIIMRGLTSTNESEIRNCIQVLKNTHAGKGFMHESFHKDDSNNFTRAWFAWANTLFGEFIWKIYQSKPYLLS